MDELQILLKAIIDDSSASSLDSQLSSIVKSLSASHEVKLKVAVDEAFSLKRGGKIFPKIAVVDDDLNDQVSAHDSFLLLLHCGNDAGNGACKFFEIGEVEHFIRSVGVGMWA